MNSREQRASSSPSLAGTIGPLTQDSYTFSGSLRENLQLARRSATERDMEQALHQVGLGELLMELSSGLDTWLGEQGARLSGCERQRLALGRMPVARKSRPSAGRWFHCLHATSQALQPMHSVVSVKAIRPTRLDGHTRGQLGLAARSRR
jgi:ABC-type hemin transport system ATPase subunit